LCERLATEAVGGYERSPTGSLAPRLVAERYGTAHREVVLRARDLFDGLPRIFATMDEPAVDG
jgi:asparagine synthetase B (glutamine-hydrolysing)